MGRVRGSGLSEARHGRVGRTSRADPSRGGAGSRAEPPAARLRFRSESVSIRVSLRASALPVMTSHGAVSSRLPRARECHAASRGCRAGPARFSESAVAARAAHGTRPASPPPALGRSAGSGLCRILVGFAARGARMKTGMSSTGGHRRGHAESRLCPEPPPAALQLRVRPPSLRLCRGLGRAPARQPSLRRPSRSGAAYPPPAHPARAARPGRLSQHAGQEQAGDVLSSIIIKRWATQKVEDQEQTSGGYSEDKLNKNIYSLPALI